MWTHYKQWISHLGSQETPHREAVISSVPSVRRQDRHMSISHSSNRCSVSADVGCGVDSGETQMLPGS